jgi:hypothetical protein
MENNDIVKQPSEFKEVEYSKLVKRWQLSVSSNRKMVELSFQTMNGEWHSLFTATDEQAIKTLIL